jgi:hypothetical protein
MAFSKFDGSFFKGSYRDLVKYHTDIKLIILNYQDIIPTRAFVIFKKSNLHINAYNVHEGQAKIKQINYGHIFIFFLQK